MVDAPTSCEQEPGADPARVIAALRQERDAALARETALAEVLDVINRSAGDPVPVFETILEKAHALCGASIGAFFPYDGERIRAVVTRGYPEHIAAQLREPGPPPEMFGRFLQGERFVTIADQKARPPPDNHFGRAVFESAVRTMLIVPLCKDGKLLGQLTAHRPEVRPYTDREITLLETFAAQAVIAMENARLLTEQQEALERQTATAEVLQVINASPGNTAPAFKAILERAVRLCRSAIGGVLVRYDGQQCQPVAASGLHFEHTERLLREPFTPPHGHPAARLVKTARPVQIVDVLTDPYTSTEPVFRDQVAGLSGYRAFANIPLLKDEAVVGFIGIYRREPGAFADNEIALLESFAAQAVIAMENARLLNEQQEALERQTATSEVLQVINASPGNLAPVFDTMLDKAMRLCGVAFGLLYTFEGEQRNVVASRGLPPAFADFATQAAVTSDITPVLRRVIETKHTIQLDTKEAEGYLAGNAFPRALVDLGGARTTLLVPLLKNDSVTACFSLYRQEVRAFAEKEIALLESFAAQAVIAMENARLLGELRARTDELTQREDELRVTFENMADGVAMFDGAHRLVAWNRNFQDLLDLPDDLLAQRPGFADYIRTLAASGEYGPDPDPEAQIARSLANLDAPLLIERTRPNGRIIELRRNPVAGGGFVVITADITERKRNEAEIAAARDAAEQSARAIEAAFQQLKTAQANLIQAEKMASLGQLTAGIAHEIKNPLNFVNNFADLSVELLTELREVIAPAVASLSEGDRADAEDLADTLTSNLRKITEHGKRADGIVRSMLEHSRGESGDRRTVDVNALAEEALNLAYHGARAQDQGFNITLQRDYGENIAPIELNPQDIARVLLNIFSNGFYAANKRARSTPGFEPTLKLTTADRDAHVEISIQDNGGGILPAIRDKLFQPFFTTKPAGEGTGLGLSITYDIVTKQHGGSIQVDCTESETTTFTIHLPRRMFPPNG